MLEIEVADNALQLPYIAKDQYGLANIGGVTW